ncbi:MAG TPA: hypothetical protein VGL29_08930 [Blastocatellia bacterium]|jgi:hypothetical protein
MATRPTESRYWQRRLDRRPQAEKFDSKTNLLTRIGTLRDALIAFGTGVYLLGYFSWAFYAWRQHLGLIPALDAQYFTAGVFPAAILLLLVCLIKVLRAVARWFRRQAFTKRRENLGKLLQNAAVALVIISYVTRLMLPQRYSWIPNWIIGGGVTVGYVSAFFLKGKPEKFLRAVLYSIVWLYVSVATLAVLLLYFLEWFSKLPQELGGPSVKCVQLDLNSTKLSQETLRQFLPEGYSADGRETQRSRNLYLIFDGSGFVLLKPDSGEASPVQKIEKSAIEGVFPCN